jgi:hypothetical protein
MSQKDIIMKNPAISVKVAQGQSSAEVASAANELYKTITNSGLKFSVTAVALLGQLLYGAGCDKAWQKQHIPIRESWY